MKKIHHKMTLGEMAAEALRKAVARVLEEHRQSGQPLAVWRNGRAVLVPADRLSPPEEKKELPGCRTRKAP